MRDESVECQFFLFPATGGTPSGGHTEENKKEREARREGPRERSDGRRFAPQSMCGTPPTSAGEVPQGGRAQVLVSRTLRAQNTVMLPVHANAARSYEFGSGGQNTHRSLLSTEFLRLLLRLWRRDPGGDLPPRRTAADAGRPELRSCG